MKNKSLDIKEVQKVADIESVIASRLGPLKHKGKYRLALCPWHDDSSPSLQVDPDRQSFKCWVCDIGGSIFDFVMKYDRVNFKESFDIICQEMGIQNHDSRKESKPMASFNRVILCGNVTRDPEIRYIASGTAVTDLGLAVNDRRKNGSGEWVDETTFVDVTLWARQAEVACEYLSKGSPVLIEGRLKLEQWENNDGQKRSKLKVIGERMQMLGGGSGGSGGGQCRSNQNEYSEPDRGQGQQSSQITDDIPF